jgi:hypothetical protein
VTKNPDSHPERARAQRTRHGTTGTPRRHARFRVMVAPIRVEGSHCTMALARPQADTLTVTITGRDTGELGDEPFAVLDRLLRDEPSAVDLFIDAREGSGATIDVSNHWAQWLERNRTRLARVTMLARSRYVAITADFVRRYAGLERQMTVTGDPDAFDRSLRSRLGAAS